MAWNRRYSLISYIKSSLWVMPILALILEFVAKRLADKLDIWMLGRGWYDLQTGFLAVNTAEAHAIMDRIFSLNMACLVFAFSSLLVAIQVAGGQYTPRIIATTLLRDNVIRSAVGLFVFTMLWAHQVMVELGRTSATPQFQVFLASLFGIASLVAFIVLIDYSANFLRPVVLVQRIGEQGIGVIETVYPYPTQGVLSHELGVENKAYRFPNAQPNDMAEPAPAAARGPPDRIIYHQEKSAIVLAVNLQGLMKQARQADCLVEFVPQVGDFLSTENPLFYLYGNAAAIDEQRLRDLVALGSERTMEHDPMFAFRIEVDIALKALSAAINDPTTAVLAIDQLERLLRKVGKRALRNHEIRDELGQPRVVLRTPNWENFVHISFREIRERGAGSLQIERRLRAMIVNLIKTLPAHRHPPLQIELELLDRATVRAHFFPEDIVLARIPDSQGLGGASGVAEQRTVCRDVEMPNDRGGRL